MSKVDILYRKLEISGGGMGGKKCWGCVLYVEWEIVRLAEVSVLTRDVRFNVIYIYW